jgi:predicted RNA polymerase sigma factor
MIAEGIDLISAALRTTDLGPYQLQAAIAAVHNEAPTADATDWPQILALYDLLERVTPNPMVALNRSVAVAEVHGPRAALEIVARLDGDERINTHHRLDAARGHFLEMGGEHEAAREAFRRAARRTTSIPERRYLEGRAARSLGPG